MAKCNYNPPFIFSI